MVAVVLIYPPYHFKPPVLYLPYVRPTLVLAHLYAVLEATGIDRLEAVDLDIEFAYHSENIGHFLEKAVKRIEKLRPDVVCLSCKAAQLPFAGLFSRLYKFQHPEAKIIMGGWMPTLSPEKVLRLSDCDAVIRGEAERSLPELIDRIYDGRWSIEGVSYIPLGEESKVIHNPSSKALTREELDNLPLPRYDVLPSLEKYQPSNRKRCFSVEASRGCPNHGCIFCWNSTKNCETSWRAKSPARVVREIRYLVDEYRAQVIFFTDDNFGTERAWLSEFTSLMKAEFDPEDVECIVSMRVDSIDPNMLEDMYRSGIRTVFHGIESGSPRQWKTLGKNLDSKVTPQYIADLVRKEVESGMLPKCSFIVGLPNETEEELDETMSLCSQLASIGSTFSLQILAPNEGTSLFEQYQGLIEPHDLYREFGESENLSPELRAVFGERLAGFLEALPDFRLVKTSMPLDRFKEKYYHMVEIASQANASNMFKIQHRRRQVALHHAHRDEVKGEVTSRFANAFRCLLRRRT